MKKTWGVVCLLFVLSSQLSFAQTKLVQQTFEGQLSAASGTSKFPIVMTLTFDDNLVFGTMAYKRVGQPIKVVGSLDNGNILLHEFDAKTDVTGIYYGTKKGDEITGTWSKPGSEKELNFSLQKTSEAKVDRIISNVTGTYSYGFGKDGGTGSVYVRQIDKETIMVEMQAIRGGPSYNQAIIEKTTLKLNGNQAVYETKEFGKCKLKVIFFNGGATIVHVNEAYECGFGNAATVAGNYLKFDSKIPKFGKQN